MCDPTTACKIDSRIDYAGSAANCSIRGTTSTLTTLEVANSSTNTASGVSPVGAGDAVELRFTRDPANDHCHVNEGNDMLSTTPRTSSAATGRVEVKNASVELRYVIIYDVTP